jgi:hypothetical protein
MTERLVLPLLLTGIDDAWSRLRDRLAGTAQDEYLWEPVADVWTLHRDGDTWLVDRDEDEPDPAPVTTIAWRIWHIASDCLASYVAPALGPWPLSVQGREWHHDVGAALDELALAFAAFRERIVALGEDGLWSPLGPAWGQWADSTWAALVIHAQDELAHHGAEIALLRDLYRQR